MSITVKRALWTALLLYTALHLAYSVTRYSVFNGESSGDFHRVYQETAEWEASLDSPLRNWHLHPPLYYVLLRWVDALAGGMRRCAFIFYFLQFLFYPVALLYLTRAVWIGPSRPPWAAYGVTAALVINFQPFLETLAMHKVEGIEFLLICIALWAFRRHRDLLCGGLLMAAANLKYLPALLLVHFGAKREWKVLLGSLLGAAAVLGVVFASFGPKVLSSGFFGHAAALMLDHQHEGNRPEASVEMQTLSGTVNRWFARPAGETSFAHYLLIGSYVPVPNPALALGLAKALKGLAVIGWLLFLFRGGGNRREREDRWPLHLLEVTVSLVMILVISQASRVHYSILVLPGFVAVGLLLIQRFGSFRWSDKALFGLAYALTGMLIPGGLLNKLPPHPEWGQLHSWMVLWWSLPFYGVVLLGLCAVRMHRRLASITMFGAKKPMDPPRANRSGQEIVQNRSRPS
jgi:hypothetical protein